MLGIALCVANAFAAVDTKQWMASLNDNIFIAQMSLPGAHNAATGHGFSGTSAIIGAFTGKCQDKEIAELWDAGVRVFDLRPSDSGDDCTINHGSLATTLSLRQALTTITGRLSTYGSEFAIVLMRKEEGDADTWKTKVSAIVNSFSDYVMPFSPNLRLSDVRGKLLILSRDYFADGYKIDSWTDNTVRDARSANGVEFVVQDYYQVEDTNTKSTAITNILAEARTNNSISRMYINHTSGYTGSTGTNSNINANANTSNAAALNAINANPGPTGMVLMDFAGSSSYNGANLCNAIIEQNSKIATAAASAPATGQYYVYNVEREMYITRSNNYGTRAGFDKAGMPIAIYNAGDGTLTLVTHVNGTGKGIFIADNNGETEGEVIIPDEEPVPVGTPTPAKPEVHPAEPTPVVEPATAKPEIPAAKPAAPADTANTTKPATVPATTKPATTTPTKGKTETTKAEQQKKPATPTPKNDEDVIYFEEDDVAPAKAPTPKKKTETKPATPKKKIEPDDFDDEYYDLEGF